jgi:hypothetical protein
MVFLKSIVSKSKHVAAIVTSHTIVKLNHSLTHKLQSHSYHLSYSQEYPKRFQKDIIKAATTITSRQLNSSSPSSINNNTNSTYVTAQGIEHVLNNIGAGDKMSRVEIESIVSEMGACPIAIGGELGGEGSGCIISADQMLDLMSKNWAEHHHDLNQ